MTSPAEIPLFPLNVVLFPGGILPLRIFEPRYLEMVRRCMVDASEFGVALIREGVEAGGVARTHDIGTLCRIIDFDRTGDGLLAITGIGTQRFAIIAARVQGDGLNVARIDRLQESTAPLPERYSQHASLLRQVLPQFGKHMQWSEEDLADAGWVAARLADILPMPLVDKQRLLELNDPLQRLAEVSLSLGR